MNPAAVEMIGYSFDEVRGKILHQLVHYAYPDGQPYPTEACRVGKVLLDGHHPIRAVEETFIRRDGAFFPVLCSAGPIVENGRLQGIVLEVREITLWKRAEQALKESEERFRSMADSTPVMIWMTDETGKLTYCNNTALSFSGRTMEEALQNEWGARIHPEDWPQVTENFFNALHNRVRYKDKFLALRQDGEYRYLYSVGVPRYNTKGEFLGYIGSAIDITERRQAEEIIRQSEQSLRFYTDKLEKSNKELETFAAIASHDLQAPLRKVMTFSDRLRSMTQDILSAEALDNIDRIQRATRKMQELITDLLMLSRVTRKGNPFEEISLSKIITDVIQDLESLVQATQGRIELKMMDCCAKLEADPLQIYQLFKNLIENGLKFHKQDVPPVLTIEAFMPDSETCRIQIQDNGIGFEEKFLDRIFMMFERLHGEEQYPGSGVGLTICQKITERHGGMITAQSRLGEGAMFIVTLPIHPEANRL